MTATHTQAALRVTVSTLGTIAMLLLGLVAWLGQDAYARLGQLESADASRGVALAEVRATLATVDARTARIERVLDDRLPPRLTMGGTP